MSKPKRAAGFPHPEHNHAPCLAETLERAERVFDAKGLRLTPLRRQVLGEIAGSHTAVGAYDLLERLTSASGRRLAPISVYRALDSLVEAGLVHRLESRNAFFACHASHGENVRQIVMACDRCRTVLELDGSSVFKDLELQATRLGFAPERTLIEISGRCGACDGRAG